MPDPNVFTYASFTHGVDQAHAYAYESPRNPDGIPAVTVRWGGLHLFFRTASDARLAFAGAEMALREAEEEWKRREQRDVCSECGVEQ